MFFRLRRRGALSLRFANFQGAAFHRRRQFLCSWFVGRNAEYATGPRNKLTTLVYSFHAVPQLNSLMPNLDVDVAARTNR
ncbi:hypothetical protein FBZ93_111106 [Bradyrhizobium macuxiense]|uniref:Uncharacterized protein n=1 Tax=Bradyrhizobium macuxiense TaxID=1755647 RepID=A0A560LCN7_9BRAD|nr:hypothetical protein FBZ93_111106 [Bradyrhizobium macuxiense]